MSRFLLSLFAAAALCVPTLALACPSGAEGTSCAQCDPATCPHHAKAKAAAEGEGAEAGHHHGHDGHHAHGEKHAEKHAKGECACQKAKAEAEGTATN